MDERLAHHYIPRTFQLGDKKKCIYCLLNLYFFFTILKVKQIFFLKFTTDDRIKTGFLG